MGLKDALTLLVPLCSLASSLLYTYVYVCGQKATFFNELHSMYASPDIMDAFDTLETFLAMTGPEQYGPEYVRLKALSRELYKKSKLAGSTNSFGALFSWRGRGEAVSSDAEFGQHLDASRRRLLHYLGKLLIFNRQRYVTQDMLLEFPGRNRALHAVRLLKPLVEGTASAYNLALDEHRQILEGIRTVFSISREDFELPPTPSNESCSGTCSSIASVPAVDATSSNIEAVVTTANGGEATVPA